VCVGTAAAQANTQREVRVYHGQRVLVTRVQLGSGNYELGVPQHLVFDQGTSVCVVVYNANPVWYDYSLGTLERPLGATETDLAPLTDLAKLLASRFTSTRSLGAVQSAIERERVLDLAREKSPNLAWLITYAGKQIHDFRDTLRRAEDVRNSSEYPEPAPDTQMGNANDEVGFTWAKREIQRLLPDGRINGLIEEVASWYATAKAGRDIVVADTTKPDSEFLMWTEITLDALRAYGEEMANRAIRIAKEFGGDGSWQDCATVGQNALVLRLTITRRVASDAPAKRLIVDSMPLVTVTPRYLWKSVEIVTGLGIVVTPGTHAFTLRSGVIADDGAETLVRPMINVTVPFHPFGERGQNALAMVAGASAFSLGGQESGGVLGHFGIGLRVQDLFSLSGGLTFGSRPIRLKPGASVGQALPSSFASLDDAIDTAERVGLFLQIAFRGFSITH
jgi:hypothetical protein